MEHKIRSQNFHQFLIDGRMGKVFYFTYSLDKYLICLSYKARFYCSLYKHFLKDLTLLNPYGDVSVGTSYYYVLYILSLWDLIHHISLVIAIVPMGIIL